ncbi:helix-turn-helix domain-containing protein [Crassaminicella indica]|uniref:Helix-turn-helix domain-containing protein n=1 Tax=Crassaminicella indica TaxID=2855394 RepID=A0ABX8RHZ6_9CLOT|nr:helix-turn-helix domain-containing protein [Crassaminicella indica]QXM06561.1 helix-turn-helix domain-containing protein [Crassaminicella indica]
MTYKKWTEDETNYLICNYAKKSINKIADDLNRSKDSIFKKAKRLGLTKQIKHWKECEVDYLIDRWGKSPAYDIANELNRSIHSVKKKAIELKLGPERIANGEFLTTGDIAYLLNKNPSLIYRWIRDGFIKGRRFGKKKTFQIKPQHLINFLKDYPDKWSAYKARVDLIKPYFCYTNRANIPEWFECKVQEDIHSQII